MSTSCTAPYMTGLGLSERPPSTLNVVPDAGNDLHRADGVEGDAGHAGDGAAGFRDEAGQGELVFFAGGLHGFAQRARELFRRGQRVFGVVAHRQPAADVQLAHVAAELLRDFQQEVPWRAPQPP